ncbi:MAG: FAD-binding protein [Mesosutterella multiformis]|nr:FAD-binding protein [Mesosutterella multiformis]
MTQFSRRKFLRTSLVGGASITTAALANAAPTSGIYKPGTYVSKASGIGGDVIVKMTFDANKITDVVIDAKHETPALGQRAAVILQKQILQGQGAKIDTMSGASITSGAVQKAAAKCIAQAKGQIPVEVITKDDAAEDDSGDWLGKAPEIAEKDISNTVTTDILVIGCGTGGMFAVCSAAENGGKVIGIDRFSTGTGIREDLGAIDSRYQKAEGTKIDKFDFIAMATRYAGGHVKQELIRLWADNSGETINWLGDRLEPVGIKLMNEVGDTVETRYKDFAIGHSPQKMGKVTLNNVLHDYAVKKGARFDYNTTMVKLEKKNGRVTGCIAKNADGKYVRYIAKKGTVVATGGYARNTKMMEALQPWNLRVSSRLGAMPGATGSGIRACLWVGAKMDETHCAMKFDRSALRPDQKAGLETMKKGDAGFFWIGSQPWLKVNADGERFMNESGTYENPLHADEYNKGHCHYSLFDSNWVKYTKEFKMHGCSRIWPFANGAEPNHLWSEVQDKMLPGLIKNGYVQKADSIEELAKKLGLPADQLKKTVKRYNELAYKGVDTDFGKEKHRLSPLDKPPFYGAKNSGWLLCTLDGIVVDKNLNACDESGDPIPGLYVIGNDSGSYFANEYPNLATGMACGRTVTFGRVVGRNLAKA